MQPLLKSLCLFLVLCALFLTAQAQIIEVPLSKKHPGTERFRAQKTQAIDTLELPFWEDFSTSSLVPDSTKWVVGKHVNINRGRGLNPPSINVATFDGSDMNGIPYSDLNISGEADSLVSQPINLSGIELALRSTVYLSFYWQKKGNSEIPETSDSLRLQFKDISGTWVTVWSETGGDSLNLSDFKQELIQVPPGPFQHAGFQFRFQSFGKLTGGYDNWHIDYILLRTRRNETDFYVRDRTLSTYPTSIFKDFTAIPFEHYCLTDTTFQDSTSVEGFSLEPPGFPASIRFAAQAIDAQTGMLIDEMNNIDEDGLLFSGQLFTTIQANAVDTTAINNAKGDSSLYIETKMYIRTKDSLMFDHIDPMTGDSLFFENIDLTVNDTASSAVILDKHYAYDDGSAESAAGVNTNNGQLAYLYVLPVRDTLTDVQIYFPNTESMQAEESLRLKIWTRLDENEVIRHTQTIFIEASDSLDKFTNYPLSRAILVGDSLFVGIEQTGVVPIFIGLDKNNDSGDRIYFNTSGIWEANDAVKGSLMLRPVFGSTDDIITSTPEVPNIAFSLYPNPASSSRIGILGPVESISEVKIFDLTGRLIPSRFDKTEKVIEFSNYNQGVYLIQLNTPGRLYTKKLILK